MGNSNGSISAYVAAFFSEPALAGGFVWDWRDQGLAEVDEAGRAYWAYGGHFGDEPNDANFCINGLVGPDGLPHPGLRELAWAVRPVSVEAVRGRRVRILNRRSFENVADLQGRWSLQIDGVEVEAGKIEIDLPAGTSRAFSVPYKSAVPLGKEAFLSFEWSLRRASDWARAGHLVAWDQIEVTRSRPVAPSPRGSSSVERRDEGDRIILTSGPYQITVQRDLGIEGILLDGKVLVSGDPAGCLWRAPTDHDGAKLGWNADRTGARARWLGWGLHDLRVDVEEVKLGARNQPGRIRIRRKLAGPDDQAEHRTDILVCTEGIRFDEQIRLPKLWDDVPRVGVRFEVPDEFDQLQWMGLGPDESYPDRCSSGVVANWTSTVAEQYHPFPVPQEHGAHAETRWFSLANRAGRGLRIDFDDPLSFSARAHHDCDLEVAATLAELNISEHTEIHIDSAVRGLGTAACGPDTLPSYRVKQRIHRWVWTLRGLEP
jgi:beta-galactosidase